MSKLLVAATVIGGLLIALGAGLVFLPAGVIVLGLELTYAGLNVDDGQPS